VSRRRALAAGGQQVSGAVRLFGRQFASGRLIAWHNARNPPAERSQSRTALSALPSLHSPLSRIATDSEQLSRQVASNLRSLHATLARRHASPPLESTPGHSSGVHWTIGRHLGARNCKPECLVVAIESCHRESQSRVANSGPKMVQSEWPSDGQVA